MGIITSIISFFLAFIFYMEERKIYSPVFVFNVWWGFNILISTFGFLGIEVPNDNTYLLFLIGIIFFNLPFIIFGFFSKRTKQKNSKDSHIDVIILTKVNRTILYIILLLTLFVLLYRMYNVINYISAGGVYSNIRWIYYNTDIIRPSRYGMLIDDILVSPIAMLATILLPILMIKKEKSGLIKALMIAVIILFSITSGGRLHISYFIITLFIWLTYKQKTEDLNLKSFIRFFIIALALLIMIFIFSNLRSGAGLNIKGLLQTAVVYFTGSFIYFEKMHNIIIFDGNYYFGGMFIAGLLDFFILVANFFGANLTQLSSVLSQYNQQVISIGQGINFNAFTTMFYNFMYDFDYAGVIINSFVFGIAVFYYYKKFENKGGLYYTLHFLLLHLVIYESTIRWMPSLLKFWVCIFIFFLLDKGSYIKVHSKYSLETNLKVGSKQT